MKTLIDLVEEVVSQFALQTEKNVSQLNDLFSSYEAEDWKNLMNKAKGKFQNTILYQDQELKCMLIHWDAKQRSKKHGHPPGGGLIQVLSGVLQETRFDPEDQEKIIGKHYYFKGSGTSYIHDELAFHVVENPSVVPAVSLHLYATGTDVSNLLPRPFISILDNTQRRSVA